MANTLLDFVMSLVRDLVAALSANDDPLLGLFGAWMAYIKSPTIPARFTATFDDILP